MFSAPHRSPSRRTEAVRPAVALACGGAVLLLVAGAVVPIPAVASAPRAYGMPVTGGEQAVDVTARAEPAAVAHAGFASEKSPEQQKAALVAAHDNYAWAKLVLWYGGWPITDASVTVIVRWMRQENGVDSWWNRNNPLNNGWGVGSYMDSNPNLDVAAYNVAEAIQTLGGYASIRDAFASGSASTDEIWYGIWTSSWASGHYEGGTHYSTAPVPSVVAPAENWGI